MNADRLWLFLWTHARAIGWTSSALLAAALLLWAGIAGYPALWTAGAASDGHHQVIQACELCHVPFGDSGESCLRCHGEYLVAVRDSHAKSVLLEAGQGDLVGGCAGCHREHRRQHTDSGGLSRPGDFCILCHRRVGSDRPTHTGRDFFRCVECHAYHDNRPSDGDFLRAHLDEPAQLPFPHMPTRPPVGPVVAQTPPAGSDPAIVAQWQSGPHAAVGCEQCHAEGGKPWKSCASCHEKAEQGWRAGRHGMALAAADQPIRVGEARGAFRAEAAYRRPDCGACHGAHEESEDRDAKACGECHADRHSRAWPDTPHARAEPPVTCAVCHLPRQADGSIEHNQSANLRPNRRMGQQVCLNCHGLEFAYSALEDLALIESNFAGTPRDILDIGETAREEP